MFISFLRALPFIKSVNIKKIIGVIKLFSKIYEPQCQLVLDISNITNLCLSGEKYEHYIKEYINAHILKYIYLNIYYFEKIYIYCKIIYFHVKNGEENCVHTAA